jgi:response regulator RpfG family c-di-GMP phosphodiesterase
MAKLKILICDDEEDIVEIISFCVNDALECDILTATNGKDAIDIIDSNPIDLIICDYNMPINNGGDVYLHLVKHNSPTRFVLCSTENRADHVEFSDQSHYFGWIQKPNIVEGISDIIKKFSSEISVGKPVAPAPLAYQPIGLYFLLRLKIMPADIYIKISDEKYVKVMSKDASFEVADFDKYKARAVGNLYIENKYSKTIISTMSNKIKSLKSSGRDSLSIQFEVNDLIRLSFQTFGFQHEIIEETQFLIQETLNMNKKVDEFNTLINRTLDIKDHYIGKHSFLLTAVTCSIAKHMNWISDLTQNKLVTASLLHDLFLNEADLIIDGVEMRESEIILKKKANDNFLNHPIMAAQEVAKIPNLAPDCATIILEQHEVGDSIGIPRKLSWSKISPLGQLFSFSHFVVDEMLRLQNLNQLTNENLLKGLLEMSNKNSNYRKFYATISASPLVT